MVVCRAWMQCHGLAMVKILVLGFRCGPWRLWKEILFLQALRFQGLSKCSLAHLEVP